MSRGGQFLAAGAGIAALFTALFLGAYYGSIYAPEKRHYQSVGPNGGQTYPPDSPKNGLADVSGIDRITESLVAKPQPRSTKEREERDLAAQENSATFAYWVFWAMLLQTALAGGALIALVKDLRQNRRSAEAQLRAYVLTETAELKFKDGVPVGELTIKNFGQTPARNVRSWVHLWVNDFPLTEPLPRPKDGEIQLSSGYLGRVTPPNLFKSDPKPSTPTNR